MKFKEWHNTALELRDKGFSGRTIAQMIGKSKTQVNDLFKTMFNTVQVETKEVSKGPKILFFDIETAPLKAHLWSMWQQGVGLNQIEADWYMLSFCCKWAHSDEVFYYDQRDAIDIEDDYSLVLKLWHFLNEADVVVGQNSKKFDTRKANARFILNGLPKPSTYRQIDTMEIAKRQFGFTSNRLEYMTDKLCTEYKKSKHKKFHGHDLWAECLKGNIEAWEEMEDYNRLDVLSLEELYNILSSWDNTLPNFDVYVDEVLGMEEWEEVGFHYTNLGKYKKYRNKKTGVQRRSRVNLLTKEKRDSLLANIV
jgi:uncharacterized protein YprB with RNaseH-like and TPR domain